MIDAVRGVLLNRKDVLLGYVFGSLASKGRSVHDIDVAVLLDSEEPKRRFDSLADLTVELSRAIGVREDRVDVIDINNAPLSLKYNIMKQGLRIVGNETFEHSLIEDLLVRYPDLHVDLRSWMRLDPDPRIDRPIIESRIAEFRRNTEYLRSKVLSQSLNDVLLNYEKTLAMERALRRGIEAVLDICRHLVSVHSLGLVESYGDYPKRLAENGMMPLGLAGKLTRLAGVRNILVHRYMAVKYEALYETVRDLVNDVYPEFVGWIRDIAEEVE